MAIYISPVIVSDNYFVDYILEHIVNAGVDAYNVELEITERTLLDDITATHEK